MAIKDYRAMSEEALNTELLALKREQFNFRIRKGIGDMPKPHIFRNNRRNIARIKTVLADKMREGESA